jgi:hypothetical protein
MSAIIQITASGKYVAVTVDSNDHPIDISPQYPNLSGATDFCNSSNLPWALGWTFVEGC